MPGKQREKVGAVESHQEKRTSASAASSAQSRVCFHPGVGFLHMVKDPNSLMIFTQIEDQNKLMMDFMICSNTDNTDNKENTLFDSYR